MEATPDLQFVLIRRVAAVSDVLGCEFEMREPLGVSQGFELRGNSCLSMSRSCSGEGS